MSADPGISRAADSSARDTSVHLNLPVWAQSSRWPAAPLPPNWLDSKPRCRAVKLKRRFDPELVKACLSGDELVSSFASGKARPYRLDRPISFPKTASFDARATWKLRGTYLAALEWIAYAALVRKRAGLCAQHAELGFVCGVGADRMYQVLRDLRAWKLVRQDPSFVRLGKVSSQRANCYRLTNVAADAFGLANAASYADPEDDAPPAIAARPPKARPPSGAGGSGGPESSEPQKTTTHPESPPDISKSSQSLVSPRASARAEMVAVSAPLAPTGSIFHAPTGSSDAFQLGSHDETCELSSRLSEPESGEAPPVDASSGREPKLAPERLRVPLDRFRRGDVDDPETAKEQFRERWRDERERDPSRPRRVTDWERDADRELERIKGERPRDLAGDAKLNGRIIAGPDEQRRHREQRELERRRREDEDFVKTIEGAWKSRGLPLTVNAQIALEQVRKRNGGDS